MDIDLFPFLCEAFSVNTVAYKDIDKLYNTNRVEFYNLSKKNEFYNHDMAKEGSVIQESYFKKSMGVILQFIDSESHDPYFHFQEFVNLIEKNWNYTYVYVKNHSEIDLEDFLNNFIRKNKYLDNITDDQINSNVIILLFLVNLFDKKLKQTQFAKKSISMLCFRLEHYNKENRISHSKISKEDLKIVKTLKKELENINLKSYLHDTKIKNINIQKFKDVVDLSFDFESFSLASICENIKMSRKEIEELLYIYVLYKNLSEFNNNFKIENIDKNIIEECAKFMIAMVYLRYSIKAYKKAKEYFFENSKETLFMEIEEQDQEIKNLETDNSVLKNKNKTLINEVEEKDREIARLKQQLEKEKQNKKEITKLREFVYKLDNEKVCNFDDGKIDLEKLKNTKAAFFGGHVQLQNKLKEYLCNSKFINVENLNFDVNMLDGVDIVFIYTECLQHATYFKIIEKIRNNNVKLQYLQNTNINLILQQIDQAIEN